ncbi:MAG TPA: hypothetical protein ENN99_06190 [Chloroflexi bacterium]|nr:hypothetical protein [Chloroflexota bacterium]
MSNKVIFHLLCIMLVVCIMLPSCTNGRNSSQVSPYKPTEVSDAGTIVLLNKGSVVRDLILSNTESQQAWQDKQTVFPVGGRLSTWLAQFTMSVDREPVSPKGLIRLPAHRASLGRLLVSNVFHTPHSLGLVFLLDYQPLLVQDASGEQAAYYIPGMPVGAEQAFEFLLPPMSEGLHHLSILLITDPNSTSTDSDYRWDQQRSLSEQRFDLWVGINEIPKDTPAFQDVEQAISAGGFRSRFEVVQPHQPDQLIERLELDPNAEHRIALCFINEQQTENTQPYTSTLPVRIGIFWDDHLQSAFDYKLDPTIPEPFLLPLIIQTPTEPGTHQLQVIAFQIPWHAQFNAQGEWISFGKAAFSRRILVNVAGD